MAGLITTLGNTTNRDYETDGIPASGAHKVAKSDERALIATIDIVLSSAITGVLANSARVYATNADLVADLSPAAGTLGFVYDDPNLVLNAIAAKVGASGTGYWTPTGIALPSSFAADLATVLAGLATITTDVATATTAANTATTEAVTAVAAANSSSAYAGAAAASASLALSAAEASGISKIYDTYAAASADLANISNLQAVEVLVDETRNNARTIYRKESGALAFKLDLSTLSGLQAVTAPLEIYASPTGSTSNTGMSSASPWPAQYAIDMVANSLCLIDARVRINLLPGTYDTLILRNYTGSANVDPGVVVSGEPASTFTVPWICGVAGDPSQVVIDPLGSECFAAVNCRTPWFLTDMTWGNLSGLPNPGVGIVADFGSTLYLGNIYYKHLAAFAVVEWGSQIEYIRGTTSKIYPEANTTGFSVSKGGKVLAQLPSGPTLQFVDSGGTQTVPGGGGNYSSAFAYVQDPGSTVFLDGFTFLGYCIGRPWAEFGGATVTGKNLIRACIPAVNWAPPVSDRRIPLTGQTLFYVNPTGDDRCDGLASTYTAGGSGPFKTLLGAATAVTGQYDSMGFDAIVNCAPGTYDALIVPQPFVGGGTLRFRGATGSLSGGNPNSSFQIRPGSGAYAVSATANLGIRFAISGFDIAYAGETLVFAPAETTIIAEFGNNFGAAQYHLYAADLGKIVVEYAQNWSGSASISLLALGGKILFEGTLAHTVTGSPAWGTDFAFSDRGQIVTAGSTWTGASTGKRYKAANGGIVAQYGSGVFPGNADEVSPTVNGGVYA